MSGENEKNPEQILGSCRYVVAQCVCLPTLFVNINLLLVNKNLAVTYFCPLHLKKPHTYLESDLFNANRDHYRSIFFIQYFGLSLSILVLFIFVTVFILSHSLALLFCIMDTHVIDTHGVGG